VSFAPVKARNDATARHRGLKAVVLPHAAAAALSSSSAGRVTMLPDGGGVRKEATRAAAGAGVVGAAGQAIHGLAASTFRRHALPLQAVTQAAAAGIAARLGAAHRIADAAALDAALSRTLAPQLTSLQPCLLLPAGLAEAQTMLAALPFEGLLSAEGAARVRQRTFEAVAVAALDAAADAAAEFAVQALGRAFGQEAPGGAAGAVRAVAGGPLAMEVNVVQVASLIAAARAGAVAGQPPGAASSVDGEAASPSILLDGVVAELRVRCRAAAEAYVRLETRVCLGRCC